MTERADNGEITLGRVTRVRVLKVTSSGVVVGFGRRYIGFIPVDEFAEGAGSAPPAQLFRTGDNLLATIVTICDGGKRIVLSLKGVQRAENEKPEERTLAETESTASGDTTEPNSFERIYRRYQRDSQMRLSLLRKNIESKRGEFR
ncbi:MAG: hypothetical protein V2G42_07530 [bacterium JZ-2024 1]